VQELTHRVVETNGIRMHIAECGVGPLVIMCHGFPESWYSWRHQLSALAEAGFHAVAPDMRGYGGTDRPTAVDQYTLLHLVGDVVGLLDALGADQAVVAGHDWGARVAWHCALLRPDRFRGVIGLSLPFVPRLPTRPTATMPRREDALYYLLYFQSPAAETEFARDVRMTIRSIFYTGSADSGDVPRDVTMVPTGGGFLSLMTNPASLPAWITEADVDHYVKDFACTGFRGGLNWYRNLDRNWELLAPFADARVTVPALFIAGDRDLAVAPFRGLDPVIANLTRYVPQLRAIRRLPACGHCTQQERAPQVNSAMLEFLRTM